jgi:hypothetical protein
MTSSSSWRDRATETRDEKLRFLTGFQIGSITALILMILALWTGWLPAS